MKIAVPKLPPEGWLRDRWLQDLALSRGQISASNTAAAVSYANSETDLVNYTISYKTLTQNINVAGTRDPVNYPRYKIRILGSISGAGTVTFRSYCNSDSLVTFGPLTLGSANWIYEAELTPDRGLVAICELRTNAAAAPVSISSAAASTEITGDNITFRITAQTSAAGTTGEVTYRFLDYCYAPR